MRALLAIVVLGCLVGCSTTQPSSGRAVLRYPGRTFADWQPDRALAEAEHDIVANTPKIYIISNVATFAPGISSEQYSTVKTLPIADAYNGRNTEDRDFLKAQFEY